MKKPYIICHMMISIDGRIDCAMTSKLRGVNDYYTSLEALHVPTTVSRASFREETRKCMVSRDSQNRQMPKAMR